MPKLTPAPKREVIRTLRSLGLEVDEARGKGGEWLIIDPDTGVSFPMPSKKDREDISKGYIRAIWRRFGIDRNDWFRAAKKK